MQLSIPESIAQSIKLPDNRLEPELLKELAVALYAQGMLSFGKSRELANLDHRQFNQLLGERKILRHYSEKDLEEDLEYARGQ